MHICILAPENSPSWGGVGSYTYNLIKHLPQNNDITVLTINRNVGHTYKQIFSDYNNVEIKEIVDINPQDSFVCNLKFQLAVLKNLKNYCNIYNFDIIHSHSGHLPHLFSQFQDLPPSIVTVHATVKGMKKAVKQSHIKADKTELYMNLFSKGIEFCEKISFNKDHYLLPVSQFTLDQINKDYSVDTNGRAKVMHTAVDTIAFHSNNEKQLNEKPVILFAGRFYSLKGFDVFLKAIELVISKGYKIKVKLVGRGNTEYAEEFLSKIMNRYDYSITGMVNYEDMPQLFEDSDILVVPSLYENCPLTILEAMSSGKIVIASNVGGIPEIIADGYNGFLFESGNHINLANILITIFEGNVDLNKIKKISRDIILQKYNWETRGKEIYDEYGYLINIR